MSKKVDNYIESSNWQSCVIYNKDQRRYDLVDNGKIVAWIADVVPDEDIIKWLNNNY